MEITFMCTLSSNPDLSQWRNPVWERQYQSRAIQFRSKAVATIHADAGSILGPNRPSFVYWWAIQSILSCVSGTRFQCNLTGGNGWRAKCLRWWAAGRKNVWGILGARCYLAEHSSPVIKWCYQEPGKTFVYLALSFLQTMYGTQRW